MIERCSIDIRLHDETNGHSAGVALQKRAVADHHRHRLVLLVAIAEAAPNRDVVRERERVRLSLRLQHDLPAVERQNFSGGLTERAVFFQPRSEKAVELFVRHCGNEVDPIDVLRRQKSILDEERRREIRPGIRRRLRKKVRAVLGKHDHG